MAETHHHGVVAIVTDLARTRFVVQQKDADYAPCPMGFSFFGGAVEPEETLVEALGRELIEELGAVAERLVAADPRLVFHHRFGPTFELSLFEIVIERGAVEALADVSVLEGERAWVVDRSGLAELRYVWDLGAVARRYLDGLPLA